MKEPEQLSAWLAEAMLKSGDENIAALDVLVVAKRLQAGEDFAEALASLQKFEQKKGDFGAEIIGTLLVPLLLEALKDFWAGYVKKLSEDAGEATAKFTADRLKSIFRSWLALSAYPSHSDLLRKKASYLALLADQKTT